MSKGRIAIAAVLVLVVVVAAGLVLLRGRLGGIVAAAIETHGSRLTGTTVTVGGVSLHLRDGRAEIRDLRVANPAGFSDRDALALGSLVLDLDPGSLRREPYVVDELAIGDVEVHLEFDAQGRRNLDLIRAKLEAAQPQQPAPGAAAPPPLLIVHRLALARGVVTADAAALGLEPRTVDLSGFALTDLGAPGGAPADRLGRLVLRRLVDEAVRAAVDQELKSRLQKALGGKTPEAAVKDKLDELLGGG